MSTIKIVTVATDFFEKIPEERVAKFVKGEVDATLDEQKKKEADKKKEEESRPIKDLAKAKDKKAQAGQRRGGDPAHASRKRRSWNYIRQNHGQGRGKRGYFGKAVLLQA